MRRCRENTLLQPGPSVQRETYPPGVGQDRPWTRIRSTHTRFSSGALAIKNRLPARHQRQPVCSAMPVLEYSRMARCDEAIRRQGRHLARRALPQCRTPPPTTPQAPLSRGAARAAEAGNDGAAGWRIRLVNFRRPPAYSRGERLSSRPGAGAGTGCLESWINHGPRPSPPPSAARRHQPVRLREGVWWRDNVSGIW